MDSWPSNQLDVFFFSFFTPSFLACHPGLVNWKDNPGSYHQTWQRAPGVVFTLLVCVSILCFYKSVWCCHITTGQDAVTQLNMCSWDQNEGRVWRWENIGMLVQDGGGGRSGYEVHRVWTRTGCGPAQHLDHHNIWTSTGWALVERR